MENSFTTKEGNQQCTKIWKDLKVKVRSALSKLTGSDGIVIVSYNFGIDQTTEIINEIYNNDDIAEDPYS